MRTKTIIKEIKKKLDSLTDETILKAKKYEELIKHLSNVKLRVKKSKLFLSEATANIGVEVEYETLPVKIIFDENNEIIKNDRFIAINMLDLIPMSDMDKLNELIKEARKRNI